MENNKVETHEPSLPMEGFPYSHVKVDDVFGEKCEECVRITIHGVPHYVHRTTAFSLYEQLQQYFKDLSPADKRLLIENGSALGSELF